MLYTEILVIIVCLSKVPGFRPKEAIDAVTNYAAYVHVCIHV